MTSITYRGLVYPWHCDRMGHMNVMWYTSKFDEATWLLLAEFGLTAAELKQAGLAMAALEQRIAYRREAYAGTCISVRSTMVGVGTTSLRFVHEMTDAATGEILAVAALTGVCMDAVRRVSTPLPGRFRDAARARVVDYDLERWFGGGPKAVVAAAA